MDADDREALRVIVALVALHAIIGKTHDRPQAIGARANPQPIYDAVAAGAVAYADALIEALEPSI